MDVGVRVVRGPDWSWVSQDGGEGYVGTLVEIGRSGSSSSPDQTVVVQWDAGIKTNYRIGYQGMYDLRVFDNAQIGVKHGGVSCNACRSGSTTNPIRGMRWQCNTCPSHNLCTPCYMADKHDTSHPFTRIDFQDRPGVPVSPRRNQMKIQALGIFRGAEVVRGPNWDWNNQDGGEGQVGQVLEIQGWDQESARSVARVRWNLTQSSNVYRVAHKGKVDLKLRLPAHESAAPGGTYYRDHLPTLTSSMLRALQGPSGSLSYSPGASVQQAPMQHRFLRGDSVRVDVTLARLKELQEGHGGWNDKMAECVGLVGFVHRITDRGDIRVQFPNTSHRWTFNPAVLAKINPSISTSSGRAYRGPQYQPGDLLRLGDGEGEVREMQRGHGDWQDSMRQYLGQLGLVERITANGDLVVCFPAYTPCSAALLGSSSHGLIPASGGGGAGMGGGGSLLPAISPAEIATNSSQAAVFTLNPACCRPPNETSRAGGPKPVWPPPGAGQQAVIESRSGLATRGNYREGGSGGNGHPGGTVDDIAEKLMELRCYERIVRDAAQGNCSAVCEILNKFPDQVDVRSNGKTALQVACHEGHVDVVRLLLRCRARLDATDEEGDAPLHYACFGNQADVVELLLQQGAGINAVNQALCTALHIAVNKQNTACVRVLLRHSADVNCQDSYGDTVVHDAISKGNLELITLLANTPLFNFALRNKRHFNVLHYAALKGNVPAAQIILAHRPDLVDVRKDDGFAALHLAALNGHWAVAVCLLEGGADADIRTLKGQTPLHMAVSQGHAALISLLVDKGCRLEAVDEEGNCCFHQAVHPSVQLPALPTSGSTTTYQEMGEGGSTTGTTVPDSGQLLHHLILKLATVTDRELGLPAGFRRPTQLTFPAILMPAFLFHTAGCGLNLWLKCRNRSGRTPRDCLFSVMSGKGGATVSCGAPPPASASVQVQTSSGSPVPDLPQELDASSVSQFLQAWSVYCWRQRLSPDAFCVVCSDDLAVVQFDPCGHKVTCADCCVKMKRCIRCQEPIAAKCREDGGDLNALSFNGLLMGAEGGFGPPGGASAGSAPGSAVSGETETPSSAAAVEDLLHRLKELEDTVQCDICMDQARSVAFQCGHTACTACATTLIDCHMCRKAIVTRINLFLPGVAVGRVGQPR